MPLILFSQEEKEYQQLHMLRLKQENDLYQYWYQSDKNFSDGIHIEVAHRIFNIKPADWFLIGFKDTPYKDFSLSIGQDLFTPSNTQTTEVDTNDRPYTGLLYFTYSKFSNRFLKGKKLYTNFFLGLQGAWAMGEEMQNGVHEVLDNPTAKGWDNQLGTGLMLDYDVNYMQLIPVGNKFFESNFLGKAHIGTMYDYVTAGILLKIGHYSDTYMNYDGIVNSRNNLLVNEDDIENMSSAKRKLMPKSIRNSSLENQVNYINKRMNRKWQYFFMLEFQTSYTFYDGTAEGSLIQFSNNVHTFPLSSEDQLVFQGEYSFNVQYGHFHMEFNRFIENDAYNSGDFFGFGEISLSWIF